MKKYFLSTLAAVIILAAGTAHAQSTFSEPTIPGVVLPPVILTPVPGADGAQTQGRKHETTVTSKSKKSSKKKHKPTKKRKVTK